MIVGPHRAAVADRYGPATFDLPTVIGLPGDTLAYGTMQLCDNEDWFAVNASGSVSVCAPWLWRFWLDIVTLPSHFTNLQPMICAR